MSEIDTENPIAIAIDMGGTTIKAGLIARDGRLIDLVRMATPASAPPQETTDKIIEIARDLCRRSSISLSDAAGFGISMAAFVTANGLVTATAHLTRDWIGFDLGAYLRRQLKSNYYFALDTPAPTLGEAYFGAGRGFNDFVYVTVSTGIGAGIIANGAIYAGGRGWAGGVGHTIIDENSDRVCEGCGNNGCLETFAGTQGIISTTQEIVQRQPESLILTLVDGVIDDITPHLVFEAAQQGDPAALEIWSRVGHMLGIGLMNLIDIVAPDRVVVGGGIAQAGDYLLEPARAVVRERAFPPRLRKTEIVQAELGDLSGLYGAAAMVFHDIRVNI